MMISTNTATNRILMPLGNRPWASPGQCFLHLVKKNTMVQQGVRFPAEKLQYDTSITARHLRQHGKKPLPPLMAEYWLITDASIAKQFSHYKPIKFVPKSLENGVMMFLVSADSDIVQWCARLEQVYAIKTGTIVKATTKFSEVAQWFGVWRTPEQSVAASAH